MVPGDRLVVAFVRPMEVGDTFRAWPLHITIVPWFRADIASEDLAHDLQVVLKDLAPFAAVVGGTAGFGRQGQKLVELIELPSPLLAVERSVRACLHEHDSWIVDETTRIRRPYRPHVTRQGRVQAQPGQMIAIDRAYLVQQRGAHKEVVGLVHLDI